MNDNERSQPADRLDITYFTDPLCCWSWAFEPQWRKLQFEFEGQLSWKYCMSGLLPSWKDYNDPTNSVSRPIQMGPVWMHANHLSGMPINSTIWMSDPPASSYPACIAVKCAMLQSAEAGEKYLRMTREAVMIGGENIAKTEVLESIATQLQEKHPALFDLQKFLSDLKSDVGIDAFRIDMHKVQMSGISRYPSLLIKYRNANPILITGYRPYAALLEAIKQIAPDLQKTQNAYTANNYISFWESITDTELKEASIPG